MEKKNHQISFPTISAFFGHALKPLGRDLGSIQKVRGTYIQGQPRKQERALWKLKGALYIQICERVGAGAPVPPGSYVNVFGQVNIKSPVFAVAGI